MKFSIGKNALMPDDSAAVDFMKAQTIGERLTIYALTDAERKFRSFVFMALTKIAKVAELDNDEMRAALMVDTGRAKMIKLPDGHRVHAFKSMNAMSMSHEELTEFWKEAKEVIRRDIFPSLDDDDTKEIEELLT
jgi:hypothetical protein